MRASDSSFKVCSRCGSSGPFGLNRRAKDGLKSWCRTCCAGKQKVYAAANRHVWKNWAAANSERIRKKEADRYAADPEREKSRVKTYRAENPDKVRIWTRRGNLKKYGITPEGHRALLEKQLGKCPICLDPLHGGRDGMQVDHEHTTGRVRGLLCHMCNILLGDFRENPKHLRAAVGYLQLGPVVGLPAVSRPIEAAIPGTRASNLWYGYAITKATYQMLLDRQGNSCGICQEPLRVGPTTHIDHDHRLGRKKGLRGLLCRACNLGLGHARDSHIVLLSAALYISFFL